MATDSEKGKNDRVAVSTALVDTAAQVAYLHGDQGPLDPEEARRVLRKIDFHILPLMCILYWIQFMDKTTLGAAAILGIREATHLTTNQYNWLGTVFYISYLFFEFPQNLALQRFPVAKWMSLNIFIWSIALSSHAACTNFSGLLVARLVLGMCEGSITAGFLIVSSMFYTRREGTIRVGYWFLMNGTAQIITGFISFGTLHIKTKGFEPWQWLMIFTGFLTLLTAIAFYFFFPDSPTSAWFLTPAERSIAVRRLKENQTGVENKVFKREQMYEALLDPKTYLFALFSLLDNIPNSLTNQRQIIVSSFGFSPLQTTLLGCVDGVIEIVTIYTGVHLASSARFPNSRAYVGMIYLIPNLLGVFLVTLLPWDNKIGLLFGVWLTGVGTTAFVLSLSWVTSVTAGHTKRVTVNAVMLSAYCIGNSAGPFMWQAQYRPRNYVPWIVIGVCYASCMSLLFIIRVYLNRENLKRDRERDARLGVDTAEDGVDNDSLSYNTDQDVYIERTNEETGEVERIKVDKEFLDLTDIQNRDFRYVL